MREKLERAMDDATLAPHAGCGGSVYVVPDVPLALTELLALERRRGLTSLGLGGPDPLPPGVRVCALWSALAASGGGPSGVMPHKVYVGETVETVVSFHVPKGDSHKVSEERKPHGPLES